MRLPNGWILSVTLYVLVFTGVVHAEMMYVTDVLKLTLRTGQSTDHKIIAVIESGQELEVLQFGEDWSQVRLPDGKEGWVLSRYLTRDITHNIKLERLEIQYKNLRDQSATLIEENSQLKAENKKLAENLTATEKAFKKLSDEHEVLKASSAEFLSLKTKYEKSSAQLAETTKKAATLEEQLSKLELYNYIKWFLAGSGVLLLGFIIGFSAKRQRRRPSLL
jgi:SH3 domain protein